MQSQIEAHHIFTYTDSELNLEDRANYCLDVCIGRQRLSMVVYQNNRIYGLRFINTTFALLEAGHNQLAVVIEQAQWYSQGYQRVRVFIDDANFTLVPAPLFDATQASTYLKLIHKQGSHLHTLWSATPYHQANCVFAIPSVLYSSIQTLLSPASIHHHSEVLLHAAAAYHENDLKHHLLVNITQHFITLLYYAKGEIKYCNTFEVDADTDTVYFILSVAEQLKLPAEQFGIYLSGDISATSATLSLLKKYIPDVIMANRLEGIQYPISFREFQEQQHYLAIHTLLCESSAAV